MFRHIVMFRWAAGTEGPAVQRAEQAIDDFAAGVQDLCTVWRGRNAGHVAGNYDAVVVADFPDAASYESYLAHPAHLALIEEHLRPILDSRAAIQAQVVPDGRRI